MLFTTEEFITALGGSVERIERNNDRPSGVFLSSDGKTAYVRNVSIEAANFSETLKIPTTIVHADMRGISFEDNEVGSLAYMFADCESLEYVDLTGWTIWNSPSWECTFINCQNLKTIKMKAVLTSSNFSGTFQGCAELEEIDLSAFENGRTNFLERTDAMFAECRKLKEVKIPFYDQEGFEPSHTDLQNTQMMFSNCDSIKAIDLHGLDVRNVQYAQQMFHSVSANILINQYFWNLDKTPTAYGGTELHFYIADRSSSEKIYIGTHEIPTNAYTPSDTETESIEDADYIPVSSSDGKTRKKILWEKIKAFFTAKADGTTLTEIKFGKDANGNYGYYKDGADSVTPFKLRTGNATADQVLDGVTFSNENGYDLVGNIPVNSNGTTGGGYGVDNGKVWTYMPRGYYPSYNETENSWINTNIPNQGAWTPSNINPSGSVTIPEGYHDGKGKVTANPNQNSGTYTYPTNSTGGTYDMGVNNTNRYVNASNVYSKGVADGRTGYIVKPTAAKSITANGNSQDVLNYATVNVAVPNTNSGTFPLSSFGTGIDMGANNTYRYINTSNAYYYTNAVTTSTMRSGNQTHSLTFSPSRIIVFYSQGGTTENFILFYDYNVSSTSVYRGRSKATAWASVTLGTSATVSANVPLSKVGNTVYVYLPSGSYYYSFIALK